MQAFYDWFWFYFLPELDTKACVTLSCREWHIIRSQTALLIPSNGLSSRLVICPLPNGISKLIQHLKLTLTSVHCIHLSIHSTIWPSSPLYHFVNRNGRRFDSVAGLRLFSSSYTRSYGHLSHS